MKTEPAIAHLFSLVFQSQMIPGAISPQRALIEIAATLPCHVIQGRDGDVYLERYGVAALSTGGRVYLHHILRSDADRELHSHPWAAVCYQLVGGYIEERRAGAGVEVHRYTPGMVNTIEPDTFHRVDLTGKDAWSLCITGPKAERAEGEASWSFWNRDTGATTPWREFITRMGLVPTPTPTGLCGGAPSDGGAT